MGNFNVLVQVEHSILRSVDDDFAKWINLRVQNGIFQIASEHFDWTAVTENSMQLLNLHKSLQMKFYSTSTVNTPTHLSQTLKEAQRSIEAKLGHFN